MASSARLDAWSPPAGFRALDSAVDGIEVFGPDPAAPGGPDGPVATRCPQCGASARFDVGRGALACAFCGWAAAGAPVVGQGAARGEFTREALQQGAQGFGVDRRELACGSCGAVIALEAGALTATCPFCASDQVAVREHATVDGIRPGSILPFTVQDAEAVQRAKTWLGTGWFHPPDLARLASVRGFMGIYLPCWAFSADLRSAWEAEVGTEKQVRDYDHRSGTYQTRTEIVWSHRSGSVDLSIRDHLEVGTTKVSQRLLGRVDAYDLDGLVAYEPALLAGFQALTYDVGLPDAWERGRSAMREQARSACRRDTGSAHIRSFSMTADLDDEAWRHLLVPAWISAYRYDGRVFVVLVNGQTGAVAGQKPVAWARVYWAIGLMLAPGVLLGLAGIPLLLLGIGAFLLVLAFVLLIAGGVGSAWVWSSAQESEAL